MDFAALGIRIDSSQAKTAVAELDKLAAVGERAQKSINETENAAKKLAKGFDDGQKAVASAGRSIDQYVRSLQLVAATNGKSARETKLLELATQGASRAQLEAADAAIRLDEGYKRGLATGERLRNGFVASAKAAVQFGTALAGAAAGGAVLFNKIADSVAKYQELSEKTGESAQNIASLQPAADASGVSLDTVATASIRLTSALSKTDDESKLVVKGIKALGLNFDEFKRLSPAQQLDAVAKSMSGFADGSEKSATAVAIFGRAGADLIPFFNDLASQGERQVRLTDEQIRAADDYTKAQTKLRTEITQLAQQIVVASIPAVTDLSGALRDGITQTLGMGDAADRLKGNNSIASFAEDGVRFLANLLDMADKVVFGFQFVGKSIGAVAAIAASVARGEFAAVGGIIDAAREDGERLLNRPNFAQALEARSAQRQADAARQRQEERGFTPSLPRINADGLNTDRTRKSKGNGAAQEAKAQLAYDLEDIRKAQDALTNTIANGEKLLEARRAANLVTEAAYWEQKRTFLIQNDAAQVAGYEKELARLQQEKLSGKDKIDNDRKILDVQAKLAKTRENAAASLEVLAVREKDALDQIRIKFEQAEAAAQSYVDTISKQNEREVAGLGKGTQAREIDSRRSQREDQFQSRREQLEGQRRANQITSDEYERYLAIEAAAHSKALAADERYWKEKLAKQQDWKVGATEALQNYYDESQNIAKHFEETIGNAFKGLEDQITSFLTGGKFDGKALIKQITGELTRNSVKEGITGPLANFAKNAIGGTGGDFISSALGGLFGGKSGGAGGAGAATAQAALATSATGATAAIGSLAAAAAAAAAALGGSSIGNAFSSSGFGTGDSFGNLDLGQFFSEGGYTGDGAKYQPAGIVHAGEYVINAENTRRLGSTFLDRLNKRGYANGGLVQAVMGGMLHGDSGGSGGGSTVNRGGDTNITVYAPPKSDPRTPTQIANAITLEQRRARRMG